MSSKARQLADLGNVYDDGALSNRNLIINGAMQVAQRGTSWTGIGNGDTNYYIDRWRHQESGTPTYEFTLSQDSDAPAGFGYSFKWQCTTAQSSLSSNNRLRTEYYIEGQDLQRLAKGTASAQEMTLSFWIKSNVTGTYVANFEDANARQVSKTFTIDSSATWEYKSLTLPADTSGSLANDNTNQLTLRIFFGAGTDYTSGTLQTSWGSVVNANQAAGLTANVASSTSNYIQFTGVQLEVGDTATPFEHRSYGDELARCERYFEIQDTADQTFPLVRSSNQPTGAPQGGIVFRTTKRTAPSISFSNASGGGALIPSNLAKGQANAFGAQISSTTAVASGGSVALRYKAEIDAEL